MFYYTLVLFLSSTEAAIFVIIWEEKFLRTWLNWPASNPQVTDDKRNLFCIVVKKILQIFIFIRLLLQC